MGCLCDENGLKAAQGKASRESPSGDFSKIKIEEQKEALHYVVILKNEKENTAKQMWRLENQRKEVNHHGARWAVCSGVNVCPETV